MSLFVDGGLIREGAGTANSPGGGRQLPGAMDLYRGPT